MSFPAPFDRFAGEVRREWIDLNGHMNLAYYVVLFDYATDMLFDAIGIGRAYKEATGHGTFAVETHTLYQRELVLGERVRVGTRLLGSDAKALHVAHEMRVADSALSAAMQELLFLHVDLGARRVVPWLPAARQRLDAAAAAHAGLPRPAWVGRRVALRRQ